MVLIFNFQGIGAICPLHTIRGSILIGSKPFERFTMERPSNANATHESKNDFLFISGEDLEIHNYWNFSVK